MRNVFSLLPVIFILLLIACSGSDTYRGSWKAMDSNGRKWEIVFDEKSFTVRDSTGKNEKYDYTQNAVNVENSVETYGIQLGDGRKYQINFPVADDESKGLIKDENGNPMYTIGRKDYVQYEDLFKLQ